MKNIVDAIVTLIKRNEFNLTEARGNNNRMSNSSNPPDFMLKGGDAVEVKKIESNDSALALNSSPPKHTLKSSSPLISKACREAEDWSEKEIIYTVGVVNGNSLKHLCMVYGRDYCASDECYEQAKLKPLDPLGITRAKNFVCQSENPWRLRNARIITYSLERLPC